MPQLLDIVGQDAAISRLELALAGERMPHAYLFVGPTGVGRRTTATALARTLLCAQPASIPNAGRFPSLDAAFPLRQACGQCQDCRMLTAGSHPDFHPVYKELAQYHDDPKVRSRVMQELGIDVIRSFLIERAGRSASRGRGKVFVVTEAELMSQAAQNALLKTLEEPPAGVTIILIARQGERLLPTTRSRCSLVRFLPLPRDFVRRRLTEEGIKPTEADFWAGFTAGSLGRALRMSSRGMYALKREILRQIASPPADGKASLGERLAAAADQLADEAVAEAKQADGSALAKTLASRQAAAAMLELIAGAFGDALTLTTGADRPLVHADQHQAVAALAERFGPDQLAEIIEQLSDYERLLWRNVSSKLLWDNVAITSQAGCRLGRQPGR